MKYTFDHDLHIHTHLSSCSADPEQNTGRLLRYAVENRLSAICVTDHFWDETVPGVSEWYSPQDFAHICRSLPLPEAEGVEFLFGCETEMDKHFTLGISPAAMEKLDFIIIPTTHLHMTGFTLDEEIVGAPDEVERRRELYIARFDRLLRADLPFEKVGVAHLTCPLMAPGAPRDHVELLEGISDSVFRELFGRTARLGMGVELNFDPFAYGEEDLERVLRPYRIAADCGCRFYLGSDAHHPAALESEPERAGRIISLLGLTEDQKFRVGKK